MIPRRAVGRARPGDAASGRAVFVVAANEIVGLGHVYRAAMIADELCSELDVFFVCPTGSALAARLLESVNYSAVVQGEGDDLATLVLASNPTVVVNDFLDTPGEYVMALKGRGIPVVSFEDEGDGAKYGDLVINALYLDAASHDQYRYGPDYFCLRDEFLATAHIPFQERVASVLVSFGGVDAADSTGRVVRLLAADQAFRDLQLTVITGPGYLHRSGLLNTIGRFHAGAEVAWIEKTRRMAAHMSTTDIALTSAGRTVFELAAMRVPAIVLAANQKEERHRFAALNGGCVYLGRHDAVTDEEILAALHRLVESPVTRQDMRRRLEALDLRGGRERVIAEIRRVAFKSRCRDGSLV